MPRSSDESPPPAWGAWLRALWGNDAALEWQVGGPADARPVLTGRGAGERVLHLPTATPEATTLAAAAHAAAHWRFGGAAQARAGLKPVQQALFTVLEDARVEWLALQELPGLRALWLPFHAGADAPSGNGSEALLARLACSLLEAAPADPHPWIARARSVFLDARGELALRDDQAVRAAASRLGNDLGQMRLPFNPATWRMHAAYRDDGSWLWEPESSAPDSQTTLAAQEPRKGGAAQEQPLPPRDEAPACYPEWDARIGRLRADWCRVHTCEAPQADPRSQPVPASGFVAGLAQRLAALRGDRPLFAGRDGIGEEFDAMALVDARLQRRAGGTPDERVYRRRTWPPPACAVQVLLDASASTAAARDDFLAMALAACAALEAAGHRSALLGYCSRGRERVEVRHLKHWHERALAGVVRARCAGQASAGSTRTGAALRHAAALARGEAQRTAMRPVVLMLGDGEPHDVDTPDPRYLAGDLGHAVAEAQRAGVAVRSVRLGAGSQRAECREAALRSPREFPAALMSLLAG